MLAAHSSKILMRQDQLEFDAAMHVNMLPERAVYMQRTWNASICILYMFIICSRADEQKHIHKAVV